jgi:hypothetical protein
MLFGDPLIGVHKVIKVTRNGSVAIYDETQDIDIPILPTAEIKHSAVDNT